MNCFLSPSNFGLGPEISFDASTLSSLSAERDLP
jgi:hypothetical protein